MTQDDIMRIAREACPYTTDEMRGAFYEGFLKGAVAEREECAKLCEEGGRDESGRVHVQAWGCAKAIRARGKVREHVMSGDCWCNPELNYTDPETGAEVWVHKEPQ